MTDFLNSVQHLLHFDGFLHWCFLLSLLALVVGSIWVVVRVIRPIQYLAKQAASIKAGNFPTFGPPFDGIKEIEQLRCSLQLMIGQIKAAQGQEVAFRNALTESQENERLRIAREIHDDTVQSLVLVAHNLERAVQAAEVNADNTATHIRNARSQLILTIDSLRKLITDLRPTVLDELGLVVAIESLCERQVPVEFTVQGHAYEIDNGQDLAIFRAAQELIHNAECHSQAKHITATLAYSANAVTLDVHDDGIGFQLPQLLQEFAACGHYGLLGVQERIQHVGGQLKIVSEAEKGTRVTVSVPALQTSLIAA